jgi:hypothetical protein
MKSPADDADSPMTVTEYGLLVKATGEVSGGFYDVELPREIVLHNAALELLSRQVTFEPWRLAGRG